MKQDEEKKKMVRAQMCLLSLQEESLSWAELPKGGEKKKRPEFCNQGKRGPINCLTSGAV